MIKKASGKNGLVELFRFLCSVWVAYYHGFFPVLSDKFGGVNISVDFFFMVSGFFFLKSIEKYNDRPLGEVICQIFWGRTKSFIVPLGIAALSVLLCNIIFPLDFGGFNWPLSFLWFFVAQFVYLTLFFVLYRKVNKKSIFYAICVVIICATMSLCLLKNETIGRVARGPAMIAIGMFVSLIPKINVKLKDEAKAKRVNLFINLVGFAISAITFVYLAYLPGYSILKLHIFTCIVCTSLLYFATAIPVRGKLFNLLGEFSIFIYLAQCPILLHYYGGTRNTVDQFGWLCFYAVVLFVINRIVNALIRRKKAIA
jgi:hypothetical protein